jgi:hypothetical protein
MQSSAAGFAGTYRERCEVDRLFARSPEIAMALSSAIAKSDRTMLRDHLSGKIDTTAFIGSGLYD